MKIVEAVDGAKELTNLGMEGFIFFAIAIVAVMFLFMAVIAYKSLSKIMSNHNKNEEKIDDAHERIRSLEDREARCIARVEAVTVELKECITQLREKK